MENITYEGVFSYIVFQGDNGYTIAQFDTKDESLTCVGYLNNITLDVPYEIRGHFVNHQKYGKQLYVDMIEKVVPKDNDAIIAFLASDSFKGIGFSSAQKIVDYLGEQAIDLMRKDISVIDEMDFLSTKQQASLKKGMEEEFDEVTLFLTKYGFNYHQIEKIKQCYKDNIMDLISENPYRLVFEVDGIGFKTADKVANLMEHDDPNYRLQALLYSECIALCVQNGSSYVEVEEFVHKIANQEQLNEELIRAQIDVLVKQKALYLEDGHCLYHDSQYLAEVGISNFLTNFNNRMVEELHQDLDLLIDALEKDNHINYSTDQKNAIKNVFSNHLSIITGGPGTGKTTILKAVVQLYSKVYPNQQIALCAPTGRASKRISEICGCQATTIHSLLKWNLETNEFAVNADNPIEYDFLIIDEFSMVDNFLFYNLCLASSKVKRMLFVGDEHQLPSVSCGNLLKDIIDSNICDVNRLQQIYRQKAGNGIVDLASKIVHGEHLSIIDDSNAKMFEMHDQYILNQVVSVYVDALNKGYEDSEVQVLSPIYRGTCGIDAINEAIQKQVNPASEDKNEVVLGSKIFREGDKVLQLKNQSEDFVFNGDIGKIIQIDEDEMLVDFDGNEVWYAKEDYDHLTLAYCISIHKSQGSEYKIVIMPIAKQHRFMLYRKLVYTGITRAKNSLVLLGDTNTLNQAIDQKDTSKRLTLLSQRLKQMNIE